MLVFCYYDSACPSPSFPHPLAVTSVVMQKNGAGLHTASSCYWDNTTDGKAFFNKTSLLHTQLILPYLFAITGCSSCFVCFYLCDGIGVIL